MTTQRRFLKSIIAASKQEQPKMPWHRGAHRQTVIAKREENAPKLKRA